MARKKQAATAEPVADEVEKAEQGPPKASLVEHVEGKVKVFNKKTGEVVEYWPRDASEVTGYQDSEWSLEPVAPEAEADKPKRKAARKTAKKTAKKRGG